MRKICQAGNKVIFDDEFSYIENKFTGEQTPIEQLNGVYYMNLWVPTVNTVNSIESKGIVNEEIEEGFMWQGE